MQSTDNKCNNNSSFEINNFKDKFKNNARLRHLSQSQWQSLHLFYTMLIDECRQIQRISAMINDRQQYLMEIRKLSNNGNNN